MTTIKAISHPDNSDSQNLFNAGSVPESINVLQSKCNDTYEAKIAMFRLLDSTGSARPVNSQAPHLLTLSHLWEVEVNHFCPIIVSASDEVPIGTRSQKSPNFVRKSQIPLWPDAKLKSHIPHR